MWESVDFIYKYISQVHNDQLVSLIIYFVLFCIWCFSVSWDRWWRNTGKLQSNAYPKSNMITRWELELFICIFYSNMYNMRCDITCSNTSLHSADIFNYPKQTNHYIISVSFFFVLLRFIHTYIRYWKWCADDEVMAQNKLSCWSRVSERSDLYNSQI